MPHSQPQLSISCASGIRTSGENIRGHVQCHIPLADISSISITMCGEVTVADHTSDAAAAQQGLSLQQPQKVSLFKAEKVLWTSEHKSTTGNSPESDTFSFSFRLPTSPLPPSFHVDNGRTEGTVQYYLQAKVTRKSWYQRNFRVNFVFPFLPVERVSPIPMMLLLPDWPGQWHCAETTTKVRKNVLSAHGAVQVQLRMPALPNIPLFTAIPVQIRINCSSKQLPSSASRDPSKFDFPRIPRITDIDLILRQQSQLRINFFERTLEKSLGSQAGFGKPRSEESLNSKNAWGRDIVSDREDPRWVADPSSPGKGRWMEEVTYSSSVTFKCSPSFVSGLIQSSNFLDLHLHLPGVGNGAKVSMGPLNITSGIVPSTARSCDDAPPPFASHQLDLPPSYWFIEPPSDEGDT